MGVSKVIYGDNVLIDLTSDTVTSDALRAGSTAHNAAGEAIQGTAVFGVSSVNGQVGDVTLDADDVGALPDSYVAPVQSVNGKTGVVTISDLHVGSEAPTDSNIEFWLDTDEPGDTPVLSVNGQTGAVTLDADDVGAVAYFKTVPGNTDLNNVVTSGFYRLNVNYTNAPSGADYSQMVVSRGSDTVAQVIFCYADSRVFARTGYGIGGSSPTWVSWRQLGEKDKSATVSFPLSWTDSGSGYYTVTPTLTGTTITINSYIDLRPDATAIKQLVGDGVYGLYVENTNGTLTAYAVGAAPTVAMTLQATVTEES